ncbi:MAG TPA: hypothetical protein VJH03_06500 [Blastocatellia bacterium]|nr:hypothetical protein [Blastocatellia bacterium]
MKRRIVASAVVLPLLVSCCFVFAQDKVTAVTAASEAAEGLDLRAVGELFKDAKNLEEFEKALNDPEVGVNNLDLDDNGEVDFIRVVEEVGGDTHVIVLQVPLGKDDLQDVATIEVEKVGSDQYNMQVTGNEVIYGPAYYVVTPPEVRIVTWPIIPWIYAPAYRPYRSVFYFGYYPRWWRPFHPVTVSVYRTRTVRLTGRTTFSVTRTRRVTTVSRVHYNARSSTRVTRKTTVTHTRGKTTVKTKTTRTRRRP